METKTEFAIAKRLETVGFSDIVQVRNKIMALRESGREVFEFHGGEPFFETPDEIKQAMTAALGDNKTHYAPSSGVAPLRQRLVQKLKRRNGMEITPEQVLLTNGGMQALFAAFQTVLNPGDECLLFTPFWTPIRDLIAGCQANRVDIDIDEAREIGLRKALDRAVTARSRAIYYNTPNNPAGHVFDRREAEIVADFAIANDLIVIADEAYEDLVYEGEHFSIASLPNMLERTLTCFTFSKTYAMTGWRLGYVVGQEPWMTGMKKMVLYSTNGVSTPTQWAGLRALDTPQEELDQRREEYRKRRDLLIGGLQSVGLGIVSPPGAFYAFPEASRLSADSREAARILLEQAQVSSVPGIVFGKEGHVRMTFSAKPASISAAIESIRKNL